MTVTNEQIQALKAAAEKATPGRIGDRIDGSGSIKYECRGYDGSLVLKTDHKNMEYGFVGDNETADEFFFRLCVPDVILSLLAERDADKAENAKLVSENAALKNSVENAAGCINAAYAEGLIDVLAESSDERLIDLVKRRLLHAYLPVETPTTDAELIAVGDWVLREQLEDGTRVIKLLNKRITELEIESAVKDASIIELKQQYQRLLEARTVSVKLPEPATEGGRGYRQKVIWVLKEALFDAGINLEVGE